MGAIPMAQYNCCFIKRIDRMAKEQETLPDTANEPVAPEILFKGMIEHAIRSGCARVGGLDMPVSRRGYAEVNEVLNFDEKATIEVVVNPRNFDVTLTMNGRRCQTASTGESAAMIQQARNFMETGKPEPFCFPSQVSFHVSKTREEEQAEAAA
jgi:hypothetical protein